MILLSSLGLRDDLVSKASVVLIAVAIWVALENAVLLVFVLRSSGEKEDAPLTSF